MFLVGGKTPDQSVHLNLTTTDSDTFGITASLYALCELANRTEADEDIETYYALRNYALMHSCTNAIMAAID